MKVWEKQKGFTIVELLIVVVVIAILAAITIVAYNGIQNRAKISSLQSTASQLAKRLEAVKLTTDGEVYPATLAAANIVAPSTAQYSVTSTGKGYCLVVQDGVNTLYTTNEILQPTQGSCVTANGLVAWWPFNGNTRDVSGNNLDGTAVNVTSASGQDGKQNTAYAFNGTSSQVLCGTSPLLAFSNALSLSAWVNVGAFNTADIAGVVNYGVGGYWLTIGMNGVPSFYVYNGNLSATSAIGLNQWVHLAATYVQGSRKIYVNGIQVTSDSINAVINNYSTEVCQIGSVKNVAARYFNGRIDDVRFYNRQLSTTEVQALYEAGAQ